MVFRRIPKPVSSARFGSASDPSARSVLARSTLGFLKLLLRIADNPFVQRSTIITGVLLSLGAVTLAGVGEWAAGGFSGLYGDGDASGLSSPAQYGGGRAAGVTPALRGSVPSAPEVPALGAPGYTIRRTVPEVRLQFTVADESGKPVRGLSPADIRVLDDQSQVDHFQDFARDENLPLRVGVLLDASDSVKKVLPAEKESALSFLQQVVRPKSDRAFIMAFGTQAEFWGPNTANPQLSNVVSRLLEPAGGTNLYDALYSACADHLWLHHENELVHRAIVLISDGEDTQSYRSLDDAISMAQRSETQIYSLTLRPKKKVGTGDVVMHRLAESTGGRFFLASSSKEFQSAFSDIEQEMRSQYFVTFRPAKAKPGFHELKVEMRAPQKFQIHARQGYYAAVN